MVTHFRRLTLIFALCITVALVGGCQRMRSLTKMFGKGGEASEAGAFGPQVKAIDASTYDAFIAQKNKLIIVDFYADWCPPCRQLGPILNKAANAHPDVVFVGRVNVDQAQKLAADNQVSGIPDVRIFKDGREVDRFLGCPDEASVMAKVAALAQGVTPAAAEPATPAKPVEGSVKPMPKDRMPPGMLKR